MKAVVIGGGGHVGAATVRELVARGWTVTAVSRSARPGRPLEGVACAWESGDVADMGAVEDWALRHDLLVDAAAPYPLRLVREADGTPSRRLVEQAEARTRGLVEAALRHGRVLAHVSSFATQPVPGDGLDVAGRAAVRALHPYFAAKEAMERTVLDAARTRGLRAVVVNPTLCLGPWDAKPRDLIWLARVTAGEIPANPSQQVNVIDVRDVAIGLVSAVEREAHGHPIRLCGHDILLDALARMVAERAGVERPPLVIPTPLAVAASLAGEYAAAAWGGITPWPSIGMALVAQYHPMSPSREQRHLVPTLRSLSLMVKDSVDWYRSIGYC